MAIKKLLLTAIIFASINSEAKIFRNAYISFEMPEDWKCNLEQTEWICRSEDPKKAKEAIIILTAKEVGMKDSLSEYENHLNTPATLPTTGEKSEVQYKSKSVQINDQTWIDGLHLSSEVPSYFTRYMATIKDKIAVLVTFSAHKNFYPQYSQDFFKTINSLRVIATKNLLSQQDIGGIRPGSEMLGPGSQNMPGDLLLEDESLNKKKKSNKLLYIGLGLVIAALGFFLYLKSKRK